MSSLNNLPAITFRDEVFVLNLRDGITPHVAFVNCVNICTGNDVGICAKFPGQLCAHVCIDTPDSYRCSCREGFNLQSDGRTCQQISSWSNFAVYIHFISVQCRGEAEKFLTRCTMSLLVTFKVLKWHVEISKSKTIRHQVVGPDTAKERAPY